MRMRTQAPEKPLPRAVMLAAVALALEGCAPAAVRTPVQMGRGQGAPAAAPMGTAAAVQWSRCSTLDSCTVACKAEDKQACAIAAVLAALQGVEVNTCVITDRGVETCDYRPASPAPQRVSETIPKLDCEPFVELETAHTIRPAGLATSGGLTPCKARSHPKSFAESAMWLTHEDGGVRAVDRLIEIAVAQCTGASEARVACIGAVTRAEEAIHLLPILSVHQLRRPIVKHGTLHDRVCARVGTTYFPSWTFCGNPLMLEKEVD
ncbi:hypothetical protein LZC95_20065 [Pendulispora brunnea]|uniref:Uncharacterized protein n=1 Tax=Pendulispora brunnea TaxID=2905690 RepID=A0ABZ2KK98_9BACT